MHWAPLPVSFLSPAPPYLRPSGPLPWLGSWLSSLLPAFEKTAAVVVAVATAVAVAAAAAAAEEPQLGC